MKTCNKLLSLLLSVLLVMSTFTVVLAEETETVIPDPTPVVVIEPSENAIQTNATATVLTGLSMNNILGYAVNANDGFVGTVPSDKLDDLLSPTQNAGAVKLGLRTMYQLRTGIKVVDGVASIKLTWPAPYEITAVNIYERETSTIISTLNIKSDSQVVYTTADFDSLKGDLIDHAPTATDDTYAWELANVSDTTRHVAVGSVFIKDAKKASISLPQSVITDNLTFEFSSTGVVELYEIEVIGTSTKISPSNISVPVPQGANSSTGVMAYQNINDGYVYSVTDSSAPNYAARSVINSNALDIVEIDGTTYYKGTIDFLFNKDYSVHAAKLYTMPRAGNNSTDAKTIFSMIKIYDGASNLLTSYDVDVSTYPGYSGGIYYSTTYIHPTQMFTPTVTNKITLEYYLSSVDDQVWFQEFELFGYEVPEVLPSITTKVQTEASKIISTRSATVATLLLSKINDGIIESVRPSCERAVLYTDDFNNVTINGTTYKKAIIIYQFPKVYEFAGFKVHSTSKNPDLRSVALKDGLYNQIVSYDCNLASYDQTLPGSNDGDSYTQVYHHPTQKFDVVKSDRLIFEFILPVPASASDNNQLWFTEIEIYGQATSENVSYTNVASAPNGGSAHANHSSTISHETCTCDAVDGKGVLIDARYVIDGSKGAATVNPSCSATQHRFMTSGGSLPDGQNLELTFGFGQKSKIDAIIVTAKSIEANGHINKIEVFNGNNLVTTYYPYFRNTALFGDYNIVLPEAIVTDSLKLVMYPQRGEGINAGTEFTAKIELAEVEIYGTPTTFDINSDTKVITAKDISNTQGACLLVATYTNENKNELASVEFVPLTNGEITKDMTGYSNYKVFFTDGLGGLISYKVIED